MRSCCWYQVSSEYDSRLVYGFVINFEEEIFRFFCSGNEFKSVDIFTDSDVEELLIKLNTSYDIKKITSVGVYKKACVADAVAGFMSASSCLNPRDISIDTYSDARDLELRTERNQRLRLKREAAKLQREEESKCSNLDMNDKKLEFNFDFLSTDEEISSSTDENVVDMPSEDLSLDSFDDALRDDLVSEVDELYEEGDELEEDEEESPDDCEDDADEDDEYDEDDEEMEYDGYDEDDDLDEVDKWEWNEDEDGEYYGDKEMDDYEYPDDTKEERIKRIEDRKFYDLWDI